MKAKIGLCWAWLAMTVVSKVQSGTVVLEAKPVTVRGGLMAVGSQEHAPDAQTYGRKTEAPFVQDLSGEDASVAGNT